MIVRCALVVDHRFPSQAGPGDDDDETPIGDPDLDDDDDEDEDDEDDDEGDTLWAATPFGRVAVSIR